MAEMLHTPIAMAILPQTQLGTVNSTLAALTTSVNTAQGLVVGLASEGIRSSGITLPTFEREQLDLARIGGSRQAGVLERVIHGKFSIKFAWGGARNTAGGSPNDATFNIASHWPGVDAMLRCCGMVGAADASAAIGHIYTPGAVTWASIGIWSKGRYRVYRDCLGKLTIDYTAQRSPVATFEVDTFGPLHSIGSHILGNAPPDNQAIAVAKAMGVANAWGATRSWRTTQIVISPAFTALGFSNDSDASGNPVDRVTQDGTDIDFSTVIVADDGNPVFGDDILALTSVPTADMTFGVANNTATAGGAVCNAHKWSLNNIGGKTNVLVDETGSYVGEKFEGHATIGGSGTAGAEASLTFW